MFLRKLTLRGYGIFEEACFDLTTDVDRPIVLVSANNGGGKTTILEALRIALHGRRAFDVPIGEADYLRTMASRFHRGSGSTSNSVSLDFDYVDAHRTKSVLLTRSWSLKRQNVAEKLTVVLDGKPLATEDAEDLLGTIVPPEIARYFFFDGERIRELAEWETEDESSLFSAVGELLGLGIVEQLRTDLQRIAAGSGKARQTSQTLALSLEKAQADEQRVSTELKGIKAASRRVRGAFERSRAELRRVGALRHDELTALEAEIVELSAERRSLIDEAQRSAGDMLPLLCARTLRTRFGVEIESRRQIEDHSIISEYLEEHIAEITDAIWKAGVKSPETALSAAEGVAKIAKGQLLPVSDVSLPQLSRSEFAWMKRVIERELPAMSVRNDVIAERLRILDGRIELLEARRSSVPVNDPTGEAALAEHELRQRQLFEHESNLATKEHELAAIRDTVANAQAAARDQRLARFKSGKADVRERSIAGVLEALPTLTERLQASKETRFARYLEAALRQLWHKTERLVKVDVSFSGRRIALLDAYGEINKRDLSAGEKQLFAVAFIYALAKLSGRHMPFVIDTPLGRLDTEHRRKLVADFIPNASHQVILLSTDTEIVGQLYQDVRPLIAHHHELADYNGGATAPVLVSA